MPYKMSWYFPKQCQRCGENIKPALDPSNYSTRAYSKGAVDVDIHLIF